MEPTSRFDKNAMAAFLGFSPERKRRVEHTEVRANPIVTSRRYAMIGNTYGVESVAVFYVSRRQVGA